VVFTDAAMVNDELLESVSLGAEFVQRQKEASPEKAQAKPNSRALIPFTMPLYPCVAAVLV
jgi:hypothetical protein